MANRCTLHKTKLEDFKSFLDSEGIAYRKGKGDYQVLQVMTEKHGWQCVYERNDMPEHFSVQDKLMSVVKTFLYHQRKNNHVRSPRNSGEPEPKLEEGMTIRLPRNFCIPELSGLTATIDSVNLTDYDSVRFTALDCDTEVSIGDLKGCKIIGRSKRKQRELSGTLKDLYPDKESPKIDFSHLYLLARNDPTVNMAMRYIESGDYSREQGLCVLITALVQDKSSILDHAKKCIDEQNKPIAVEWDSFRVFKIREAIKEYNTALENREHGGVAQNKAFEKIQEILR